MSIDELVSRFQAVHGAHAPVLFQDKLARVRHVFMDPATFLRMYQYHPVDFIYDRTSGLFLAELSAAYLHEDLMATLYRYYTGTQLADHEAADQYLQGGWGMFRSRANRYIFHGAKFQVPPVLRPIHRDMRVLM